jgi:hypothetical protein
MKYVDLIEFCRLIVDTEADITTLRDYHVKPEGPIAGVWGKVHTAIQTNCDFDFRRYLQNTIDMIEDEDDIGKPPINRLH